MEAIKMKKIAVIYLSNTGNTQAMAEAVATGATSDATEVSLLTFDDATLEDVKGADAIAFGCPACGTEELDEDTVVPFMEMIKDSIDGKAMVLFGSFGWGDGAYIEDWERQVKGYGANLLESGLTNMEDPDANALSQCQALGKKLQ